MQFWNLSGPEKHHLTLAPQFDSLFCAEVEEREKGGGAFKVRVSDGAVKKFCGQPGENMKEEEEEG